MKNFMHLTLFIIAVLTMLSFGLVAYSGDFCKGVNEPAAAAPPQIDAPKFLAAHGLTQDNFSIWLKEHSVWREKYKDELKNYSFIPQEGDVKRR